jgi:hypothetical protein
LIADIEIKPKHSKTYAAPHKTPQHLLKHPETLMDEEEWVYAWEEDLVDEDGQLWVVGR